MIQIERGIIVPKRISTSREVLNDALALSTEVLGDLESGKLALVSIGLKVQRFASLLGDSLAQKSMRYELSGYPTTVKSMPPESWDLACKVGRQIEFLDPQTGNPRCYVYVESIGKLEEQRNLVQLLLSAGRRPEEIVQTANLLTTVHSCSGHRQLNYSASQLIEHASQRLESRRTTIHHYVCSKHYELKFSGIADEVFTRIRAQVDARIGKYVPGTIEKFASVHDNLRSMNPEDWSNAAHSCRRILKELADKLFPPQSEVRVKQAGNKTQPIKLGEEQYINRLITFVEEKSSSQRFQEIVGSHLDFLGNRLDSICQGAHKGTHSTIIKMEEADRIVIYTYMILGDILSLIEDTSSSK